MALRTLDPPRRRRGLTADEKGLWREAMAGTKPLRPLPPDPEPELPVVEVPAAGPETPAMSLENDRTNLVLSPKTLRPVAPLSTPGVGLDRRTSERFMRGKMELQGRIDLHGMTQDSAYRALQAFVHRGWTDGRRCILVITGKGASGEGILRQAVPLWLSQPPLSALVLSFSPAQPKDGGAGALYVLLRRRR